MNAQRDAWPSGLWGAEALARERLLLRAACLGLLEGVEEDAAISLVNVDDASACGGLAAHRFCDSLHQIIFECLRALGTTRTGATPQELLARLTNCGFPEVDVKPFFEPLTLSREHVATLIHEVCAGDRETR